MNGDTLTAAACVLSLSRLPHRVRTHDSHVHQHGYKNREAVGSLKYKLHAPVCCRHVAGMLPADDRAMSQ
eukprot:3436417-Pleurochrysis_carterae.AAC.1